MINQQLFDYIKQGIDKGLPKDRMKQNLLDKGWPEAGINEAFAAAESPDYLPVPAAPAETGKLIGFFALLEKSFGVYKSRFWTLVALTAIPIFAVFFIIAVDALLATTGTDLFLALIIVFSWLFIVLIQFWSQISLLYAIKDRDEKIGIDESFRRGWKKLSSFVWMTALVGLVIMGGCMLFIIPALIFSIWFAFAYYILVNENIGGMNALMKSKAYVQGHWWSVLWRLLIITGCCIVLGIALGTIAGIVALAAGGIYALIFFGLIYFLTGTLMTIFPAVYSFLLYENLKEIKGNFTSEPKGKGWLTAAAIFGGLAIILGTVININMSNAHKAAQNAKIESYMDQMRTAASFWQIGQNYTSTTYIGFNTSEDGLMLENRIKEISGEDGYNAIITEDNYCIKAKLAQKVEATSYSQGGDYWCIDSANGYSGAIEGDEYCTAEKPYCPEYSSYPAD